MTVAGLVSRPQLISMPSSTSTASSDLDLDDQPAAASTSSSAWPSPSAMAIDRFPTSRREGIRLWSAVEEAKEALRDAGGETDHVPVAPLNGRGEHGDPATKRWRASSGFDNGVESVDLARALDGDDDDLIDRGQDCDFGAIGPDSDDVSGAMAAFTSTPSTPDVSEGGDGCAFAVGCESPVSVANEEDAAFASGLFPLGRPMSSISFCRDDQDDLVPPGFFPGQTIPTLVVLELPRYTCLPHRLSPALNISLIGILRYLPAVVGDEMNDNDDNDGWAERILINVGVGLEDGLDLWQKDATVAWERLSERRKKGRSNPAVALPGGKYTLPLTVQVPSNPTLPPTFDLPTSPFEIAYHLSVTLTVDDPTYESIGPDDPAPRIVLDQSARGFDLLPTTLPSVAPDLAPITGLLEMTSRRRESFTAMVGAASAGWLDRFSTAIDPLMVGFGVSPPRTAMMFNGAASTGPTADASPMSWSIVPSLPTTSFSPSSVIPVDFALRPPAASPSAQLPAGQVIIRAALLRREYLHTSQGVPPSNDAADGLVSEEEIVSCIGRHDMACVPSVHPSLPRLSLPLGFGAGHAWANGFSTSISVSPAPSAPRTHVHCASRFYLSLQVAFAPTGSPGLEPATGAYILNDPTGHIPLDLASRTIFIPISIGSVGEPPGANRRAWRELYLGRNERTGEERPQLIDGCAVDHEEGWILPPPSYEAAIAEPEYIL